MQSVTFANLWIDGAWRADVALEIEGSGWVTRMLPDQSALRGAAAYVPGLTLPGLADAHCHAFQRLLPA